MLRAAGDSDSGAVREINEDAWLFLEEDGDALAVVTDGLGGSASGVVAAELTVAESKAAFERRIATFAEAWWNAEHVPPAIAWAELTDRAEVEARVREIRATRVPATPGDLAILDEGEVLAAIARQALLGANAAVVKRSSEEQMLRGIGATAVVAMFGRGAVGIAHVGDARVYLLRDGELRQLTRDHSLLNAILDERPMTPEEIEAFPHRTVITRGIGFVPEVEVEVQRLQLRQGDTFLLCTDGITNTFADPALRDALERGCEATAVLMAEARRSSRDNATALVIEVGYLTDNSREGESELMA